jgi:drug/metabolite transporter (DMT)-like permease
MATDVNKTASTTRDVYYGIVYALITLIGNGIYPLINNTRPVELDGLFFSWMTVFTEFVCVLPFFIWETIYRQKIPPTPVIRILSKNQVNLRLGIIGVLFSAAIIGTVFGLSNAGTIAGSTALKTSPLYSMILGAMMLRERMSIGQIFMAILMLTGLYYMATAGTWQIEQFSWGIGVLLLVPLLWAIGHALAKPILQQEIVSVTGIIMIRTGICTILIGSIYLPLYGFASLSYLFSPRHLLFMMTMGGVFGAIHIGWYHSIKKIQLGVASALVIPSPIITAILAVLFVQDKILPYHIVGMVSSIIGLYGLIVLERKRAKQKKSN